MGHLSDIEEVLENLGFEIIVQEYHFDSTAYGKGLYRLYLFNKQQLTC